jgi:hypothetical protein
MGDTIDEKQQPEAALAFDIAVTNSKIIVMH